MRHPYSREDAIELMSQDPDFDTREDSPMARGYVEPIYFQHQPGGPWALAGIARTDREHTEITRAPHSSYVSFVVWPGDPEPLSSAPCIVALERHFGGKPQSSATYHGYCHDPSDHAPADPPRCACRDGVMCPACRRAEGLLADPAARAQLEANCAAAMQAAAAAALGELK